MGPSGSGKTSLLDALAHRLRSKGAKLTGTVMFNGKIPKTRERRANMSYVAQEDTLLGAFTVRETLWFAARFFYGYSNTDVKEIEDQIETLIDSVGLRVCADTIVGSIFFKGLSGGQKKRLSIAIELISRPPIVMLDEPTSGLDSAAAFAIMTELRNLAALGHTIVATVHQPASEIWQKFDQFMLLGSGMCAYAGDASNCTRYFTNLGYECPAEFNPADFVINLVTTDFDLGLFKRPTAIRELADAFDASAAKQRILDRLDKKSTASTSTALALDGDASKPPVDLVGAESAISQDFCDDVEVDNLSCYARQCIAGGGQAGFFSNTRTLTQRNLQNIWRNPGIFTVRWAMYITLSVFLGLTYLNLGYRTDETSVQARIALMFFVAAFFVFMSIAVLPFVIEERSVFVREKRNGAYTVFPYVISSVLALLPGTFVIAATTSVIIVEMAHLKNLGWYIFCLWAALVYAECFCLFVGSVSPHYIIGIAAGAGFFGLCMTVEGFFIVFDTIGWYIRWIGYVTPHRYSFRAFMRNEFTGLYGVNATGGSVNVGQPILDFYFPPGTTYIESVLGDIGVAFLFALSYIFLFYLVLEYYW